MPCVITFANSKFLLQICLLLLSAGVIRNHVITEKALRLDDSLQFEVKDLVSSLVIPGKQPNHIDPNYAQVLFESCGEFVPLCTSTHRRHLLLASACCVRRLFFSKENTQFFCLRVHPLCHSMSVYCFVGSRTLSSVETDDQKSTNIEENKQKTKRIGAAKPPF